jgi:hypothetical protein
MTPAGMKIAAIEATLAPVLEKFPEAGTKIRRLFQQSPSFQSLCEDYRDCLAAWQYWGQAASEEAPSLSQSYTELLQELEQEVQEYLQGEEISGFSPGKR